jgi:hypothetical protein
MTFVDDLDLDGLERLAVEQAEALRAGIVDLFEHPEVKDALRDETVTTQVVDEVASYYVWSVERGFLDPSQSIPTKDIIWHTFRALVDHEARARPSAGEWISTITTTEAAELAGVTVGEYLRYQAAADARSFPVREPTGRPPGRPPTGTDDVAETIELLEDVSGLPIAQLRALLKRRGPARMPLALAVAEIRAASLATPPALADALQCSERAIERLVALSVG